MTTTAPEHAPAVLRIHPLNQPCPHCRTAAVLLTGITTAGAPAHAECGNCGRAWTGQRWAQLVNAGRRRKT